MTRPSSAITKSILIAAVAAGSLAFISAPASAETVCNRFRECWHVKNHVVYPAAARIVVRTNAWEAAHHNSRYHWRNDREEHGYYRNGLWIAF